LYKSKVAFPQLSRLMCPFRQKGNKGKPI